MSDQTQAATETSTQTPAAATTTTAAAPAATTTSQTQKREEITLTSEQLAERLERERKTLLKSLGVETEDDAKTALAAFKAKQDAEKTEAQKNAEKLVELDKLKARNATLEDTTKARAAREFALLTDSQKSAVLAIAGEDHAAQLKAIDVLSPTWAQQTPPAATTTAATTTSAPKTAPASATTAPPRTAPADTATTQATPKEQYAHLKATNPVAAAAYLRAHAKEIYPSA